MVGIGKWLVSKDVYGHPVGVNYRGSGTYQTSLGAFCTLALYVLATVNSIILFQAFLDNSKQEEKSAIQRIDKYKEGP